MGVDPDGLFEALKRLLGIAKHPVGAPQLGPGAGARRIERKGGREGFEGGLRLAGGGAEGFSSFSHHSCMRISSGCGMMSETKAAPQTVGGREVTGSASRSSARWGAADVIPSETTRLRRRRG